MSLNYSGFPDRGWLQIGMRERAELSTANAQVFQLEEQSKKLSAHVEELKREIAESKQVRPSAE